MELNFTSYLKMSICMGVLNFMSLKVIFVGKDKM
jgi:hypothetical protein